MTTEVSRLLEGAAKAITSVRYCWLVTEAKSTGVHARPMGCVLPFPHENNWTVRFVTNGRSRKAADIRRVAKVGLVFQQNADDAFVVLTGTATLLEQPSRVRQLWRQAYDAYFPTEADRANAAFAEVSVERMELWIRGVTPEPFGLHPTVLERDSRGTWRLSDLEAA